MCWVLTVFIIILGPGKPTILGSGFGDVVYRYRPRTVVLRSVTLTLSLCLSSYPWLSTSQDFGTRRRKRQEWDKGPPKWLTGHHNWRRMNVRDTRGITSRSDPEIPESLHVSGYHFSVGKSTPLSGRPERKTSAVTTGFVLHQVCPILPLWPSLVVCYCFH